MSIKEILKANWGYSEFRPLQEEIIESVIEGRDTLALLPTGGGKSICYQVPGLYFKGLCLVISPLIALMKDQVKQLKDRGINAAALFSGMHKNEIQRILDNARYGHLKFLYLSPERLETEMFKEQIENLPISFIAVDEAHCISQWGFDFRPSYLKIGSLRKQVPNVPILAVTATATKAVQKDIIEFLEFKDHQFFTKSFVRDNLSYSAFEEEGKDKRLIDILSKVKGSAIVYVQRRKQTRDVAALLKRFKISADYYHAGLPAKTRHKRQESWMLNKVRVMVSTNAFGMGIDKPNVRLVVHYSPPQSLEAYYQEAGRAGRDGKRAFATMFYQKADLIQLEEQIKSAFPPIETIKRVYKAVGNFYQLATGAGQFKSFLLDLPEIARVYEIKPIDLHHSLKILQDAGYLETNQSQHSLSTLWVIVDKEELYKFEIANKRLEPYLKVLLRTYSALFDNYQPIEEERLAKNLGVPVQYVNDALTILQQQGMISWMPRTDKPYLTYLEPRMPVDRLQLNPADLEKRKKLKLAKLENVKDYLSEKGHCRTLDLVHYFNEKNDIPCGLCDWCLLRKKEGGEELRREQLSKKILGLTGNEKLEVAVYFEKLSNYKKPEIVKQIRWMLDNGQLVQDSDRKIGIKQEIK